MKSILPLTVIGVPSAFAVSAGFWPRLEQPTTATSNRLKITFANFLVSI
jgi:hypothetical protein